MQVAAPLSTRTLAAAKLPWPVQIHQEKGFALLRDGQMAEAAAELRMAIAEGGADPFLQLNLAIAYMNLGEWQQSGTALMAYLQARPGDALAHVRMGVVLRNLKKLPMAHSQFQRALKLDPRCAAAWCQIGETRFAEGNWIAAAEAYQQALALKPNYIEALTGLGDVCSQREMPGNSMDFYEEALAAAPAELRGGIYTKIGKLLTLNKRFDEACHALELAFSHGIQSETARYELGLAYLLCGQRNRALEHSEVLAGMGSHLGARLRQIMAA